MRNYQARNFMRDDMQVGDGVLFYASNADPSGVTGLATIVRAGYPEPRQAKPIWHMVDIAFVERFAGTVSLETLKATRGLAEDDGHAERQPAIGAAGDQSRIRHRRPPRPRHERWNRGTSDRSEDSGALRPPRFPLPVTA